jgi:GAF domain-containing protein
MSRPRDRGDVVTPREEEVLELVAAHDEREMARLLLEERARVQEARSILADLLPGLPGRPGLEADTVRRARAFIGE